MKIGLCGTMSVGKTTLVHALQQLPEFKGIISLELNALNT
jgi:deoxyadenosine/deoxycytidine kinase